MDKLAIATPQRGLPVVPVQTAEILLRFLLSDGPDVDTSKEPSLTPVLACRAEEARQGEALRVSELGSVNVMPIRSGASVSQVGVDVGQMAGQATIHRSQVRSSRDQIGRAHV